MSRGEKIVLAVLVLWLIQAAAFGVHYGCYPSGPNCPAH